MTDPPKKEPAPGTASETRAVTHDETQSITNAPFGKIGGGGWIALHRSDESLALLGNRPNAFLLLTQIAMRAKWKDCPITGLKAGQAFIGDWKSAGLQSEKIYRIAKTVLTACGFAAFKGANKGTVATLLDSRIFSISREERGDQTGGLGASQGRTEGEPRATNKKERRKHGSEGNNPTDILEGLLGSDQNNDDSKDGPIPSPKQQAFEALRLRVGRILGRRPTTKWSPEDLKLLKGLGDIHEDDMVAVEEFYSAIIPKEQDFRRTSMERLLKHWTGEVDKARTWAWEQKNRKASTTQLASKPKVFIEDP